jgi:hypothetical protein
MVSKKSVSKKSVVKKSSPKKSAPKKMSAAQKAAVAAAAVAVLGGAAYAGKRAMKSADFMEKFRPKPQPQVNRFEMAKQYLMKRLEAIKAAYQKGFFTASQAKKEEEKAVKEAEQIAKA